MRTRASYGHPNGKARPPQNPNDELQDLRLFWLLLLHIQTRTFLNFLSTYAVAYVFEKSCVRSAPLRALGGAMGSFKIRVLYLRAPPWGRYII